MEHPLPMETATTPGVQIIALDFVERLPAGDEGRQVLVDTGPPYTTDALLAALEQSQACRDLVILTHGHGDHVLGLGALPGIRSPPTGPTPTCSPRAGWPGGWTPAPHCPDELREMVAGDLPTADPIEVSIRLADGDTVPGFDDLTVVHTPGHSAGHIAILWDHAGGVMVVGDAAANQGALMPAPVAEDHELNRESLRRLAGMDFEVAVFGPATR